MKIRIVAIGKVKEEYLRLGISEYCKRISAYSNIEIVEVNDEPFCEKPNLGEIEKGITTEGKRVLKLLKDSDYVISLDLGKKEMKSEEFAEFLNRKLELGGSNITFIIGGSYGLSKELKQRANDSISLSQMTFLHQMTRLILLEQIYRGFKINHNEVYHKWFGKNLKSISI